MVALIDEDGNRFTVKPVEGLIIPNNASASKQTESAGKESWFRL